MDASIAKQQVSYGTSDDFNAGSVRTSNYRITKYGSKLAPYDYTSVSDKHISSTDTSLNVPRYVKKDVVGMLATNDDFTNGQLATNASSKPYSTVGLLADTSESRSSDISMLRRFSNMPSVSRLQTSGMLATSDDFTNGQLATNSAPKPFTTAGLANTSVTSRSGEITLINDVYDVPNISKLNRISTYSQINDISDANTMATSSIGLLEYGSYLSGTTNITYLDNDVISADTKNDVRIVSKNATSSTVAVMEDVDDSALLVTSKQLNHYGTSINGANPLYVRGSELIDASNVGFDVNNYLNMQLVNNNRSYSYSGNLFNDGEISRVETTPKKISKYSGVDSITYDRVIDNSTVNAYDDPVVNIKTIGDYSAYLTRELISGLMPAYNTNMYNRKYKLGVETEVIGRESIMSTTLDSVVSVRTLKELSTFSMHDTFNTPAVVGNGDARVSVLKDIIGKLTTATRDNGDIGIYDDNVESVNIKGTSEYASYFTDESVSGLMPAYKTNMYNKKYRLDVMSEVTNPESMLGVTLGDIISVHTLKELSTYSTYDILNTPPTITSTSKAKVNVLRDIVGKLTSATRYNGDINAFIGDNNNVVAKGVSAYAMYLTSELVAESTPTYSTNAYSKRYRHSLVSETTHDSGVIDTLIPTDVVTISTFKEFSTFSTYDIINGATAVAVDRAKVQERRNIIDKLLLISRRDDSLLISDKGNETVNVKSIGEYKSYITDEFISNMMPAYNTNMYNRYYGSSISNVVVNDVNSVLVLDTDAKVVSVHALKLLSNYSVYDTLYSPTTVFTGNSYVTSLKQVIDNVRSCVRDNESMDYSSVSKQNEVTPKPITEFKAYTELADINNLNYNYVLEAYGKQGRTDDNASGSVLGDDEVVIELATNISDRRYNKPDYVETEIDGIEVDLVFEVKSK